MSDHHFTDVIKPLTLEIQRKLRENARGRKTSPEYGDLFLIFPGMGPPKYLSHSGAGYIEGSWDYPSDTEIRPATLPETISCYTFAAKELGIPALRELLPTKSKGAEPCSRCSESSGWLHLPKLEGGIFEVHCAECSGLGWIPPLPWQIHPAEIRVFLDRDPNLDEVVERAHLCLQHAQHNSAAECARHVLRRDLVNVPCLEVLSEANTALGNIESAKIQLSQLETIRNDNDN